MFMLKRVFAALLIGLLCATGLAAQSQPQTPGAELKKLDYFAGTWKSEGDMKPGPMGPGGKFTSTEQNEWMSGGFFLLSHAEESTPIGSGKGLAIFGYDTDAKVYTYQAYNSRGEAEHAKGTLAGDTWTWTNEEKMQGKVMRGRFTIKTLSPTSYTFKFEMAPEGGDWATMMEGKATKTK
jgi:hypothetical protein